MNVLGVHAGLWGFDWSPAAALKTIASAKAAGFGLIEIPAISNHDHDWHQTKRLIKDFEIEASVSLALDFDSDINSTNEITSARGEQRLNDAIDFAHVIGAKFVGGVTYSAMGRYLSAPSKPARANSLAVLRRVAKKAKDHGVTIGVEYVNRYESNLLNSANSTMKFIDELQTDNVVLHLDTFHAQMEEANLNEAVSSAISHLGYIHASESHRGVLGSGAIDWKAFFLNLKRLCYQGPITVETFSPAVINQEQAIDIGLWEARWTDPDRVAAEAFKFLNSLLEISNE